MKKILFLLIFFLTNCGYEPIYLNKDLKNYEFRQIILSGEENINRQLINSIDIQERKNDINLSDFFLASSKLIEETSKNSKGQTQTLRSTIKIEIKIKKDNTIIKNRKFVKSFNYSKKDKKLELLDYQENIQQILVNEIIEEIIFFLNR